MVVNFLFSAVAVTSSSLLVSLSTGWQDRGKTAADESSLPAKKARLGISTTHSSLRRRRVLIGRRRAVLNRLRSRHLE